MGNRFQSPFEQQFDANTADFLVGGLLYFYVTGTDTPADTYSDSDLSTPNTNPVELDAAGRHGDIFLDPSVTYKVVLKDADLNTIDTADPVVDPAANISAAFRVHAGDPNGALAGNAGSVGGSSASVVWDITNHLLYVCTTSGDASTAVWTQVGASLAGQVTQTGVITPATLAANANDYDPPGLAAASVIRASSDASRNITGIAAQPEGTLLTIHNIGSNPIILKREDSGSAAANRFATKSDISIRPNVSVTLRYDGTSSRWRPTSKAEEIYPPGFLFGLALSNNGSDPTNDINIASGKCISSDEEENLVLASTLTKRLDAAWAVGTGNGGLDTGAIANTTYHVWLIKRSDTGVVDALFSASASSPTMPTNYDYKRRIGSILRESAAIVLFSQLGDEFLRLVPIANVGDTNPGTSAVLATLSVPLGVKVNAIIKASIEFAEGTSASINPRVLITSPDQTDTTPTASLYDLNTRGAEGPDSSTDSARMSVRTDTSARVRYRSSASNANLTVRIMTHGWTDTRGRLA